MYMCGYNLLNCEVDSVIKLHCIFFVLSQTFFYSKWYISILIEKNRVESQSIFVVETMYSIQQIIIIDVQLCYLMLADCIECATITIT